MSVSRVRADADPRHAHRHATVSAKWRVWRAAGVMTVVTLVRVVRGQAAWTERFDRPMA
jgi:hypothetical protein